MQEGNLFVCIENAIPPVVRASGELDHDNCAEFEAILTRALGDGHGTVVLALGELKFIDSCGLRVLIKAAMDAGKAGRNLRIASMTPHLDHVLTISGVKDLFGVGATVEAPADRTRPAATVEHCFEVPGVPDICRQVRNEVADFAQEMGFDAMALDDVKLAVGEAISNAVRHGSVRDESIQVKCRNQAGTLSVTLKYPSSEFDPNSIPPPTYASAPEGGMGIYFMKLVMDRVDYEFKDGFAALTIEKRLP